MGAEGKPIDIQFTANYDGKDYPVTGNPDWDTIAIKRIDAYKVEVTPKKAGKVVSTNTRVVSNDGKTMTITEIGVNAKGENFVTVQSGLKAHFESIDILKQPR